MVAGRDSQGFAPRRRAPAGGAPPQDRHQLSGFALASSAPTPGRLRSGSAGGSRGVGREKKRVRGGSRGAAPGTSAGAQPGQPRVPLNPVTQQIMAGEAGFLLLPPLPGDGQEGGGLLLRPPTRARRPLGSLGVGRGSHLPSSTRSAYRRSPLDGQPAPPLTSVSGLAPNIRRKCVRPGEGRKESAGRLGGTARGRGSHASGPRGTWGQGRCGDVGWRGAGGGSGPLLSSSATPTAGGGGSVLCQVRRPVSTKSLR